MTAEGAGGAGNDEGLREEALVLSRYLVGAQPGEALSARYAAANRRLFGPESGQDARERAVVEFCVRHPIATGPLDAACALLRPGALLRKKVLVMAAVLETTPEFAEHFVPSHRGGLGLFARLGAHALVAALELAVGCLLLPVVR